MTLEIIGAGLGRTGTESMRRALEMLGRGPCHHMYELHDNPDQVPAWVRLVEEGGPPDWDAIFAGYQAQVDWPGAHWWRELADHYPRAKVILTVRDPDAWYASMERTILASVARGPVHEQPHRRELHKVTARCVGEMIRGRETAIALYEAHNRAVTTEIAPGRLLVFETGAGWEPLCAFLGLPVPEAPFPRSNAAESFRGLSG